MSRPERKIIGILDYLYRPLTERLAALLARTRVEPNHVTLARMPVMGAILWLFLRGDAPSLRMGGILMLAYDLMDKLDGDLARAKKRKTALGSWLEFVGDYPFSSAPMLVGLSLTWALWQRDPSVRYWVIQSALTYGAAILYLLQSVEKWTKLRYRQPAEESAPKGTVRIFSWAISLQWELLIVSTIFETALSSRLGFSPIWLCMAAYAVFYNLAWMAVAALQFRAIREGTLDRPPGEGT